MSCFYVICIIFPGKPSNQSASQTKSAQPDKMLSLQSDSKLSPQFDKKLPPQPVLKLPPAQQAQPHQWYPAREIRQQPSDGLSLKQQCSVKGSKQHNVKHLSSSRSPKYVDAIYPISFCTALQQAAASSDRQPADFLSG